MDNKELKISFASVLIYTFLMNVVRPDNGSLIKIAVTSVVWISFITALYYSFKKLKTFYKGVPKLAFCLYILLLVWNVACILRSLLENSGSITTLFGNPYTSLSLLVPFVTSFGIVLINLYSLRDIISSLMKIGVVALPLSLPLLLGEYDLSIAVYYILFAGSIFLLPTIVYETRQQKFIIILACIVMVLIVSPESRTTLVRDVLLLLPFLIFFFWRTFLSKTILRLTFSILFVPLFFLYDGVTNQTSVFSKFSQDSNNDLTIDTRTFLYQEVFEDLVNNKSLTIGKGANSTYYSEYFTLNEGDSNIRITVEVGFLAIILRGGLIAVLLNFMIFIYAVYLAFFKSNNFYSVGIGCFILIHIVLLFVENIVSYSLYNFILWFCVGLSLNSSFRRLNDVEVLFLQKKFTVK